MAIANHVDKDLKGCFAKQSTLAALARCNRRTAGTHIRALADRKVITPGDHALVAHLRADARPDVWDLNPVLPMEPEDATCNIFPPRQANIARRDKQETAARPANLAARDRQDLPTEPGSEPGPETSPSSEAPSAPSDGGGGGGDQGRLTRATAFVDALDYRGRQPGRTQQAKLCVLVAAALTAGWTEQNLRAYLDLGNAAVQSPAAVYRHRLAPGELPTPPARQAAPGASLPPWCGHCGDGIRAAADNAHLRLIEDEHGNRRPCPDCNPNAQRTP